MRSAGYKGTAALLSASKEFDLEEQKGENPCNIKFWCKRGATIQREISWIRKRFERKVQRHGDILPFIWLGTCDLTKKDEPKPYIEIRDSNIDRATDSIVAQLCDLLHEIHRFLTVTPILLETSIYSIAAYNKAKSHQSPETFHDQDLTLFEQVETLNTKLRPINIELGLPQGISPKFNLNLEEKRKPRDGTLHEKSLLIKYNLFVYFIKWDV